ncbi:hypothetical protein AAIB48_10150 [Paraclostridium benzoelyticum]|uniref:hypothetical protein n=1 Tax=Paraclostridium benzoelyticum TaxID=1629550 RepID=UPI0031CD9BF8
MNKNFNIYIFDDKEKAQDFNYEADKTQTLIKAVNRTTSRSSNISHNKRRT